MMGRNDVKTDGNEMEMKCNNNRFRVEVVEGSDRDDADKEQEDEENKAETTRMRNLKYFTREALPRLDNYRHIMSIQAAYRPTLEDLHDPVPAAKISSAIPTESQKKACDREGYNLDIGPDEPTNEFGWIRGVLMPNLLTMCGSLFFLRFTWIVAQAGLVESVVLIAFVAIVSLITALSVSAIATNGIVKRGGVYVMMSRSLGPEFGTPIGIILLVCNVGLCAMYIMGLMEYAIYVSDFCTFDCNYHDIRTFSVWVFVACIVIVRITSYFGALAKIQITTAFATAVALIYFFASAFSGMRDGGDNSRKFTSFDVQTLKDNLYSKYPVERNSQFNLFFSLFAMLFPAFSEILAGVNMCGRLKDPLRAIPRGTLLSLVIAIATYVTLAVAVTGTYAGELVNSFKNSSVISTVCVNFNCKHTARDFYFLMEELVVWKTLIHIGTVTSSVYCVLTNYHTALTSIKILCTDAIYLRGRNCDYRHSRQTKSYLITAAIALPFFLTGQLNTIAPVLCVFLLSAYALINFSTFHISLIQPVGWRPTFKVYNKWFSLFGSILCLCIMFLINLVVALATLITILALYLVVSYQKPDVNWGSSTQAQTYNNALLSVYTLNSVEDHVKNYRPQVLVLTGFPPHRPALVTFARFITKNLSLMVCGHILEKSYPMDEHAKNTEQAQNWLKFQRVKAFYTQIDETNFEIGAKSLMQATGLGKLKPNILLMGYKANWMASTVSDLNMYFNTIHKALDSRMAICILRVKGGFDASCLQVDHDHLSSANDEANDETLQKCQGQGKNLLKKGSEAAGSFRDVSIDDIYKSKDGLALSTDVVARLSLFQGKQKKGTIDVWWLYDDGGLTLLLPYIISTRKSWGNCKLRVFALSTDNDALEFEQRNMASLLSKFRIDYSDLTVFTGLKKKPQEETVTFYESLIKDFVTSNDSDVPEERVTISENDLTATRDKTNRHLRLRELMLEHSQDANLIVMTLPIPRKSAVSDALYMSWLECLSQGMPPFLLVRGNQSSVLTFYS